MTLSSAFVVASSLRLQGKKIGAQPATDRKTA